MLIPGFPRPPKWRKSKLDAGDRSDIESRYLTNFSLFWRRAIGEVNVNPYLSDGREEIFNVHLKTVKTEKPPKLYAKELAQMTPGFSGAQIANIVNEAALLAARNKDELVKLEHFEQSIDRVQSGAKKSSTALKAEQKQILASIEAGKCLTSWLLPTQDPVLKAKGSNLH